VVAGRGFRGDRERAVFGFHAGNYRRHSRRGIGRLLVGAVSFRERDVRQTLEAQQIFLAACAALLTFEYARGGDGRDAHSVADKEYDVLRTPTPRAQTLRLLHGTRGVRIPLPPVLGTLGRKHAILSGCFSLCVRVERRNGDVENDERNQEQARAVAVLVIQTGNFP